MVAETHSPRSGPVAVIVHKFGSNRAALGQTARMETDTSLPKILHKKV